MYSLYLITVADFGQSFRREWDFGDRAIGYQNVLKPKN